MSCVVHFEIPADDLERVAGFINKYLAGKFKNGRFDGLLADLKQERTVNREFMEVLQRKKDHPDSGVLVTTQDKSVDACLKKIAAAGGSIVVPKRAIPGLGTKRISVILREMLSG
jgi:predicted enzyme related to lactoylglutathione lyase